MRFILLLFLVTGCVTPYQPKGFMGGYEDFKLGSDKYRVVYHGNGYTSQDRIMRLGLARALEVCEERGFSDFKHLGEDTASETTEREQDESYTCTESANAYAPNSQYNCQKNRNPYAFASKSTKHVYVVDFSCTGEGKGATNKAH
jgi:hypothetical protein